MLRQLLDPRLDLKGWASTIVESGSLSVLRNAVDEAMRKDDLEQQVSGNRQQVQIGHL